MRYFRHKDGFDGNVFALGFDIWGSCIGYMRNRETDNFTNCYSIERAEQFVEKGTWVEIDQDEVERLGYHVGLPVKIIALVPSGKQVFMGYITGEDDESWVVDVLNGTRYIINKFSLDGDGVDRMEYYNG